VEGIGAGGGSGGCVFDRLVARGLGVEGGEGEGGEECDGVLLGCLEGLVGVEGSGWTRKRVGEGKGEC